MCVCVCVLFIYLLIFRIVMYLCASHIIVVVKFGVGYVESWPHGVFGYG